MKALLLSRRWQQRERLSASVLSICSFVCLFVCRQNAKNAIFSKKNSQKQFRAIYWRPIGSYVIGLFKEPIIGSLKINARLLRSAILKIDMMSFFSAGVRGPISIKFRRLVQNVDCGDVVEIETRCRNSNIADVWANSMACHPRATIMPHCKV